MNILYVENHAIFAAQVCQQFLAAHSVRIASSLGAARDALAADRYDLDDGKGDDLVRACRMLHPGLKIVAASAHDAGNAALVKRGGFCRLRQNGIRQIGGVIAGLANRSPSCKHPGRPEEKRHVPGGGSV